MLAELVAGVDPTWMFTNSAPVIKEKEFWLDGVFTTLVDALTVPLVFVEAQMQTDDNFYRR